MKGLFASYAAIVFSVLGPAPRVQAAVIYAHAGQTISNLAIASPTVTITGLATATQDSTTVNGSGIANSDPADAVQAYQGGAPASPQNFFSRYARAIRRSARQETSRAAM